MNRDELKYRGGMAKRDLINYIEKRELVEDETAYSFLLHLLKNILDYQKKQDGPNKYDLKKFVLSVQVTGAIQPVDSLIYCIIEREKGSKGDAAGVVYELLERIYLFGEEHFKDVKDGLKNLLLDIIPGFNQESAAAFIRDDLLSEEGLAYKAAFWENYAE